MEQCHQQQASPNKRAADPKSSRGGGDSGGSQDGGGTAASKSGTENPTTNANLCDNFIDRQFPSVIPNHFKDDGILRKLSTLSKILIIPTRAGHFGGIHEMEI